MAKSIPFSVSVIDRNWSVESIAFPFNGIDVYSIDKVSDLLKKLYIITNISPSRMHVRGITEDFDEWYKVNKIGSTRESDLLAHTYSRKSINLGVVIEDHGRELQDNIYPKLMYKTNPIYTDLPIHALTRPEISMIAGVPCDNQYIVFKKMSIDVTDVFLSHFAPLSHVVVIVLDEFIEAGNISILQDNFVYERVYDGFIRKYFPQIDTLEFQDFLRGDVRDVPDKIKDSVETEKELFDSFAKIKPTRVETVTSMATLTIPPSESQSSVNLRNLFDKFHISPLSKTPDFGVKMMYIEIPIENSNRKYVLTKLRANASQSKILARFKQGLTFVKDGDIVNISAEGGWLISTQWKDDEKMNLDKIITYSSTTTKDFIAYINTLAPFFAKDNLTPMNEDNAQVTSITVLMFWPRTVSYIQFRTIRQEFYKFIVAGMADSRTSPLLEVLWNKGVINPCVIRFYHRVTDIKIEIVETTPEDFANIYTILSTFITVVNKILDHGPKEKEVGDQKLIRKLREQDSTLYDKLKKGNIYSKKCQGIRQPIIYTKDEYDALKPAQKASVTQYWNFTKNAPAYYACQIDPATKKPLVISFLTNIHEDDYCVPCCKKKILDELSKHHKRDETCLKEHSYSKIDVASASAYIFVSGKSVTPARLGFLPPSVIDILELEREDVEGGDECTECAMAERDENIQNWRETEIRHADSSPLLDTASELAISASGGDCGGAGVIRETKGADVSGAGVIRECGCKRETKSAEASGAGVIRETKSAEASGGYKPKPNLPVHDRDTNLQNRESIRYSHGTLHYFAFGVPQNFNATTNAGIVYALSHAMDLSVPEFIEGIIQYIKKVEPIGISAMLPEALLSIFVTNVDFYDWAEDWATLFADLVLEVYDFNVIIFRPHNDTVRVRYNLSPKILIIQYDFDKMGEKTSEFYPVYKIDSLLYSKTGAIHKKTFQRIKEIDRLIPISTQNDLTFIQSLKLTIKSQFINLTNKCYAVIASTDAGDAYIPIIASPLVSRIPLEYKVFKRGEYTLSLSVAREITKQMYGVTSRTLWYNEKFIGYVHDDMNVYCSPISDAELKSRDEELHALPRQILTIDYDDVNDAILNGRKLSENVYNLYSEGYYLQHLYKLIKIELLHLIDSGAVHFDTVKQMTPTQLMNLIPHVISAEAKTDSNIIISCTQAELKHCADKKLIVPPNFIEYCEILLHEIKNPVVNFLDNQRSLVINNLQFEKVPGEKILINVTQEVV